jgi:hypothetical protein
MLLEDRPLLMRSLVVAQCWLLKRPASSAVRQRCWDA